MNEKLALVSRRDSFELIGSARTLAENLCKTEFVPASMRNRPEAVMAAILVGNDLGLPPMTALSNIYVIEGRPTISAMAMRGLILARGHDLSWGERTTTRVILLGRRAPRAGERPLEWTEVTWTMDDARRAHLDNKQNWKTYPRAMLMARCTGELGRALFADLIAGIPYTREEAEDGLSGVHEVEAEWREAEREAERGSEGESKSTTKRRARRPAVAAAAPEPPMDAVPDPEPTRQPAAAPEPPGEAEDPSQASATEPAPGATIPLNQQVAMLCREAEIDRHDLIRAVTDKEQGRDLTRQEAETVLNVARAIRDGRAELRVDSNGDWYVEVTDEKRNQAGRDAEA
jgi:hypothetical protein